LLVILFIAMAAIWYSGPGQK